MNSQRLGGIRKAVVSLPAVVKFETLQETVAMEEIWKDVVGYEGSYQVSNHGRVKSVARRMWNGHAWWMSPERIRIPGNNHGRLYVPLQKNGSKARNYFVHQLVLTAFVGPCPEDMEACHFPDRDPSNNRLENLRWDTHHSNIQDKFIHGTTGRGKRSPLNVCGENHNLAKLTEVQVRDMRELRKNEGLSFDKIARRFGVTKRAAILAIKRITWKHVV